MENRPIISNIAQNIEHNGIKQVWNYEIHQKTGTYEATVHEIPVLYKNEFYAADITLQIWNISTTSSLRSPAFSVQLLITIDAGWMI